MSPRSTDPPPAPRVPSSPGVGVEVVIVVTALWSCVATGCWPDATLSDERHPHPAPGGAPTTPQGGKTGKAGQAPPASLDAAPAAPDDGRPARLGPLAVTLTVDCVRVQAEATRPVTARAQVAVDAADAGPRGAQEFPLAEGATLFDAAFRVQGPSGAPARVRLLGHDQAGLELQTDPVDFALPARAGALVITEVLANPAGAETRQEYVELANLGSAPVSTAGWRIEDAAGSDDLPTALIPGGARALVVGTGFDEQSPSDVPPRAGTALLRVAGRIGRDGLGQAGEIVRLRGPDGAVQSSYGGWVDTRRPAWAGQSVHRRPDETACDHPSAWSASPLPATPGW